MEKDWAEMAVLEIMHADFCPLPANTELFIARSTEIIKRRARETLESTGRQRIISEYEALKL